LDPSVGSELVALAARQANREGALSTAKAKVEELEREVADLEKEVSEGRVRQATKFVPKVNEGGEGLLQYPQSNTCTATERM
jgi:archaellum component FlaC